MLLQIPTIDISRGLDHPDLAYQLGQACAEWGFFQVQGHGISRTLRAELFAGMTQFFALPKPAKLALSRTRTNFWGYYDRELTKNRVDNKEIYDIDANLDNLTATNNYNTAIAQVPWPETLPDLQPVVLQWLQACEALSQSLLGSISNALDESSTVLNPFFLKDHTSFLRFNYYPATPKRSETGFNLGIHPHTDAGALTVLAQDRVPGLQVRKNDNWHTVIPAEDSFIINIGDMMQVWSNDRFVAPEHRVLASGDTPRFSAPYFYNPAYDTVCQPLQYDAARSHYRPVPWGEFRQGRAAGDYANLGEEVQISHYRKQ